MAPITDRGVTTGRFKFGDLNPPPFFTPDGKMESWSHNLPVSMALMKNGGLLADVKDFTPIRRDYVNPGPFPHFKDGGLIDSFMNYANSQYSPADLARIGNGAAGILGFQHLKDGGSAGWSDVADFVINTQTKPLPSLIGNGIRTAGKLADAWNSIRRLW